MEHRPIEYRGSCFFNDRLFYLTCLSFNRDVGTYVTVLTKDHGRVSEDKISCIVYDLPSDIGRS